MKSFLTAKLFIVYIKNCYCAFIFTSCNVSIDNDYWFIINTSISCLVIVSFNGLMIRHIHG